MAVEAPEGALEGSEVPLVSGVAIGADTDNTADRVEAWFGDLSFRETA